MHFKKSHMVIKMKQKVSEFRKKMEEEIAAESAVFNFFTTMIVDQTFVPMEDDDWVKQFCILYFAALMQKGVIVVKNCILLNEKGKFMPESGYPAYSPENFFPSYIGKENLDDFIGKPEIWLYFEVMQQKEDRVKELKTAYMGA